MFILIKVDAREGEESCWVTEIGMDEISILWELLKEIEKNSGYFPTPNHIKEGDPRPDLLYSGWAGWNSLVTRLPTPVSGFHKITEVHVFQEAPISLYM
jgi:hypothetical protein